MRHLPARPTPQHPWRRRFRALFTGLISLALVMTSSASIATPTADDDIAAQLREAIETQQPTVEEASDGEGGDDADDGAGEGASDDGVASEDTTTGDDVGEDATTGDGAGEDATDVSTTGELARASSGPVAQDITPFQVPPGDPGPNEAKIIVTAGGDRTGSGPTSTEVAPLAGATFEFFRTNSVNNLTGGTPLGLSCTTDATGQCGVFVPLNSGMNFFYAEQTAAPADWIIPEEWAENVPFRFSTRPGIENAGTPAERTRDLPMQISNTAPDPVWASVRPNPQAAPQCGMNMAMVVDLSNSVTLPSGGDDAMLPEYKDAAQAFIEALAGTPSRVALHTFATDAPAAGSTNGGLPLTSVATAAGVSQLTAQIQGYAATGGTNNIAGGTNWDRGFHQVAEAAEQYDVVLFLTDGAPTFHRAGAGNGNGSTTNIREVNEAILSANAVKATGAQVIVIGIGPDADLPGADIRIPLISGPTEGEDYFRTEFEDLAETLEAIATANCAGTLTVVKEVEDAAGNVSDGGAGWTFTTETTGVTPASAVTDDTSAVNFAVTYPEGVFELPVTVAEPVTSGYVLAPVDGDNAVCVNTTTGASAPVVNDGELGFTVDVPAEEVISCTVRNVEQLDYDDLTVSKTAETRYDRDYDWTIEKLVQGDDRRELPADAGNQTFTYDVTVTPSPAIDTGHEVFGTITVTNPNDVAFTGVDIDDELPGGSCTVTGDTDVTVPANGSVELDYECDLPAASETTAGTNTVTVEWDAAAFPGTSGAAQATADYDFADASVTTTDAQVQVVDNRIDLTEYDDGIQVGNIVAATTGEVTFTYDLIWPLVPGECVTYDNTATITNTVGPQFVGDIVPLVVNESSTETVTVCAGLDLEVDKNVVHSFDRTYLWEIEKDVDETELTIGPDGTATFEYTVTATPQEFTDSEWTMTGTISVTNPNDWLDITAEIGDAVDVGGGAVCTVEGEAEHEVLVPGDGTVELDYTCTFTSMPNYAGTNTATAIWDADVPTPNRSAVGTADVEVDGWSQTPINDTVEIIDDQTDPANPVTLGTATWNADGTPFTETYSLTLEGVPGTCVDFTNTAWIFETGQDADQTVTVCEEAPLTVTKTAEASFDRTYHWDIDKSADHTSVTVDEDTGEATFDYLVEAVPNGSTDSGWALSGEITVTNPNDFGPVTITDVTDAVDVDGGADCTVEDAAGVVIAAGGTQTFAYDCTFTSEPDDVGINTATVTWTDADGTGQTATGETGVEFELDGQTDLTVEVYDDMVDLDEAQLLGTATWNAAGTPIAFPYDNTVQGIGGACVDFTNTAWVEITAGDNPTAEETVELCLESVLEHDKTAVSADQQADGSWVVRYEIDVVNPSAYDGVYSLSDTLEYGAGITPTTAIWFPDGEAASGGIWSGLPDELTAVLTTDEPIAAGETHTYVVLVTANVAENVIGSDAGTCSGDEGTDGGGFLNAATLTAYGQDDTARDCAEPVAPTIVKTAGEPVDGGDGTWDVPYSVVVDNPSDTQGLFYDLSDELAFADGVVIESASVSRDGTTYADWDGQDETTIVTGEALPAGATHTYTVTVTVSLIEAIDDEDRTCGINGSNAGQGLFNGATLTSGNDEYEDEACVPVPDPELELVKTATGANQNVDGSWTVSYDVVVTNASTVGGSYDLTDTLEYGDGISATAATWALEGTGVAGAWDLTDGVTTTLADGRALDGGESHTYTVTVTAEVEAGVIGTDPGTCSGDEGTDGGGFLNAANLTAYDQDLTDRDCLEPETPGIEKVFGSAVQQADATWVVSYFLEVDNSPNEAGSFYDLADEPYFAEGVTTLDQSVTDVTDAGAPVDIPWDGESLIADDVAIAGGETHRYEVSFTVRVSAAIPDENLECDPEEGVGYGFFNTAVLSSGNDTTDDDDCGPITESVVPDVNKVVTDGSPVQNADGTWTVTYDVVVSTPEANTLNAAYTLSDELDFGGGITVLEAAVAAGAGTPDPLGTWTGIAPATAVTDGEVVLPAGETHTYTVTVEADVAAGVIGTEAGQCGEDGQGENGGFFNTVLLTSGDLERTDDACAEPVAPTIVKTAGALVDNDDGTWDASYSLVVDNASTTQGLTYDLSDELTFADGVVIESASVARDGTVYEDWDGVEETTIATGVELPAGATHTYTVSVTVSLATAVDDDARSCGINGSNAGQGLFNGVTLGSGNDEYEDEACVSIPDPELELDKTVTELTQNTDGSWTVAYEVEASNTSTVGGFYDLTDTLEFGEGITPTSAAWVLEGTDVEGEWDLEDSVTATLADGRALDGSQTHTYVVTVNAEVEAGAIGGDAGICSGDEGTDGGGFLNAADLTAYGQDLTDRDCVEPVAPTIVKTAGDLVDNDDGTWGVSYSLVVDNPSDVQGVTYDLSDELAFAEGVVIESASISLDGTVHEDWDGVDETTIATGVELAAGATHTYTVSVTVSLSTTVDDEARTCGINGSNAGQGLFNGVTLGSGNDEYEDEACVPIPDPELELAKTVTGANQNADGSWTVTYEVVASNVSTVGGSYDLSDTLEFGEGITPTSAAWVLEGTDVDGEWDLEDSVTTTLADGRALDGGDTHTYVVTVTAEVEAGVIGTAPGICSGDEGTDGGGFLNTANLTAYGQDLDASDCIEPGTPDLEKIFGSASQRPDTTWDVAYTLIVDNSGNETDAVYTLSDTPAFSEGITILEHSVFDVSGTEPVEIEWDGEGVIVSDVDIDGGAEHRYEVTFQVRVAPGLGDDDFECDPEEGVGYGFFNSAELDSGGATIPDQDCGVLDSVVPLVSKAVDDEWPVQNEDGTWTVAYDIVVSTPEANTLNAVYSLSDELRFGEGITVLDSDITAGEGTPTPLGTWTGLGADTAVTDGEIVLPAGVAHTYTVTVRAEAPPNVVDSEAGQCSTLTEPEAGGFLNTVVLVSGENVLTDDACTEPGLAPWTLSKVSDPESGSTVEPGDVITYTVTATPTGEYDPLGLTVRDDMTDVLAHASGSGDIVVSTGTTSWDGDVLVWSIPRLSEAATLTYQVVVDDDAWDVELYNVVTGDGPTPPICVDDCETTHITPPVGEEPDLPSTGVELGGPLQLALLLALGGLVLATTRRRQDT